MPNWEGISHGIVIFGILISFIGWLVKEEEIDTLILLYLISLVCFSSAIANQYIAIPMTAVIIFMKKESWIYSFIGGVYLLLNSSGLHLSSLLLRNCKTGFFNHVIRILASGACMYTVLAWILLAYLVLLKIRQKNRVLDKSMRRV